VLVTGGSGTIGSHLVKRLLDCDAAVVRVFGRDETKQFYQRQALGPRADVRFLVGDVRDRDRLMTSTSSSTAPRSSTSRRASTTRSR
jgi:UDP-N-acetylglucosamine 4,6-dehydratase